MKHELTEEQWVEFDQYIYNDNIFGVLERYRAIADAGLTEAVMALRERRRVLLERFPDKFVSAAQYRSQALANLQMLTKKVIALVSITDGDDFHSIYNLYAITAETRKGQSVYNRYGVCKMKCIALSLDQAIEIGKGLAELFRVPHCLMEYSYGEYYSSDYGDLPADVARWIRRDSPVDW